MTILQSALSRVRDSSQALEEKARSVARQQRSGPPDVSALAVYGQDGPFSTPPNISKALRSYQLIKNWVSICLNCIINRATAQPYQVGRTPSIEPEGEDGEPIDGEVTDTEQEPESAGRRRLSTKQRKARNRAAANRFKTRRKVEKLPRGIREKAAPAPEVEIIPDHKLLAFLSAPNHVQNKAEFIAMSVINLYAVGECYWIGGEHEGQLEAWAVPTSWLSPEHVGGLFSGYRLKPPDAPGEGVHLEPDMVARVYNPDPSDFKKSLSVIETQLSAIKVDQSIQQSQEQMFARGIFPQIAITIGQNIDHEGRPTGRRPVLTGAQRAGLTRAVRQVWRDTVGQGDAAILDGLIEKIEKLSHTPQEMDWMQSSQLIKERVFQAFGLHPFMVGAEIPGSYSQAYVAQQIFAENVINPLLDKFSTALTEWLGKPLGLLVWIEPYEPVDQTQRNRMWQIGRQNNDANRNEYRTEVLNLPPVEEDEDRPKPILATTPAGITALNAIAAAQSAGQISEQAAIEQVMYFFECDEEQAKKLIEKGEPPAPEFPPGFGPPGGPPGLNGPKPPPFGDKPPDGDVPPEDGETPPADGRTDDSNPPPFGKGKGIDYGAQKIKRSAVKQAHVRRQERLERQVRDVASRYFQGQLNSAARKLRRANPSIDYDSPKSEAERVAELIFKPDDWAGDLMGEVAHPLGRAFMEGAAAQVRLAKAVSMLKAQRTKAFTGTKLTTAEEALEEYEIELPDDVVLQMPQWLLDAAKEYLEEAFEKDYWVEIDAATLEDIKWLIEAGIEEGYSIKDMAKYMEDEHGYSKWRATNVARTETTGALNGGHEAGIRALVEEAGLDPDEAGKEWMSVLGPTTRDTHADADGQIVSVASNFEVGGEEARWPGDPNLSAGERCNCFPGFVNVLAKPLCFMRAWYEGTLHEITTASGRRVTVTKQHPVLSETGWIAAGKVKVGDKLWAASVKPKSEWAGEQVGDEPAAIEKIFKTLRKRLVSAGRSASLEFRDAHAADFYGDGKRLQGQIEIVWTDRGLRSKLEAAANKVGSHNTLFGHRSNLGNHATAGATVSNGVGVGAAAASIPGCGENGLVSQAIAPSGSLPVTVAADRYAAFRQAANKPGPSDPVLIRDSLQRDAADVFLDHVVQVRTYHFSGQVYDLQSQDGAILASDDDACNGIITSNCQCTLLSAFVGDDLDADEAAERILAAEGEIDYRDQIHEEYYLPRVKRGIMLGTKYNPDQPRDELGRWTDGGGGTAVADEPGSQPGADAPADRDTSKPQSDERDTPAGLRELHQRISRPDGGFTYQPVTEEQPTTGYALSPYPERSFAKDAADLSPRDIATFIEKNADMLTTPEHYLGAWHDPASGKVYLDVSVVTQDQNRAHQLALEKDQIAYFDLAKFESVTVNAQATSGGAGKAALEALDRQYRARYNYLRRGRISGME